MNNWRKVGKTCDEFGKLINVFECELCGRRIKSNRCPLPHDKKECEDFQKHNQVKGGTKA